ncbi:hypothetical protein AAG570_013287 [Ranatra chinensis]|uniref:Dual specificity protein phosphatase n=1 Tax=Ranatra chinensis TaxID=642074 RepID=A0ABD0Z4M1_9HEMI
MSYLSVDCDKAKRILETLTQTRAYHRCLPGYSVGDPEGMNREIAGVDCDEVYNNIFIGDVCAAKNKSYLRRVGITHVLNAAEGSSFGMVNTYTKYYEGTGIKYMGIRLMDLSVADIASHFYPVADFIEAALNEGGKVLVHCLMGISRSATFVLAFLMIKRGMSACEAMAGVRRRRNVHPNDGFIRSLATLDNKLARKNYLY